MARKVNDRKKYHLKTNDREVLPIQNRIKINPTVILFLFLFGYLAISVIRLITRESTGYYEVVTGDNGKVSSYSAFVCRNEDIVKADRDGYVNYLVDSGDRIRVGQSVCTIDEKGDFTNQLLSATTISNNIEDEALLKIKNSIRTYAISYDPDSFDSIYEQKKTLNSDVMNYLSDEIINKIGSGSDSYTFNITKAKKAGIFTNTYDGYEGFNPDNFKLSDVLTTSVETTTIKNMKKVDKGDSLYKLVYDDKFTIIFQMTEDDVVKYWDSTKLSVYFPELDKELVGEFSFVFASDDSNTRLARIDFSECGYLLVNKRITSIQINSSVISGLKIPKSSLTTKDYYVVPKSYLTRGGNTNLEGTTTSTGLNRQIYKGGSLSVDFVEINNYRTYDDYLLIDTSYFDIGDIIVQPDTRESYEIGAQKSLQGVYNINKGYAIFKPVNVLDTMDNGFVIIEKGVKGSVSVYDHIALNADATHENELIY